MQRYGQQETEAMFIYFSMLFITYFITEKLTICYRDERTINQTLQRAKFNKKKLLIALYVKNFYHKHKNVLA